MIGTYAHIQGEKQYAEAMTDPRKREIEPGLIMRPFHIPVHRNGQEWHVYCERHPEFGFCGQESFAAEAALEHANATH